MNIFIDIAYNILIFPLVQIIDISFAIFDRLFDNKIISIFGVSIAVSFITLPLYFIAENLQNVERNIQIKMKDKIKKIKSAFKGDEQFLILKTYYKQNNYHPIYSLRNSLVVLVQIPFFIAAYGYLSNLEYIKNTSFLFIKDLGYPDSLFSIGQFSFNILPVLMFLINILSGYIYTKNFANNEKIKIFSIALLFFILLYNSPSSLVIYWTMNNIFSLLKNIIVKIKNNIKIIYFSISTIIILINIRFLLLGYSPKRIIVIGILSLFILLPVFKILFIKLKKLLLNKFNFEESSISHDFSYILSVFIIFILSGIFIPSSLIASSVQEFSFLENFTTPFPFIFNVFIQSLGTFLFWPLSIYFLSSKKIRSYLSFALSLLSIVFIVNVFIFPGDFGYMTTTFSLSNPTDIESNISLIIINSVFIFFIIIFYSWLLLIKKRAVFQSIHFIIFFAVLTFSIINMLKIYKDFNNFDKLNNTNNYSIESINNNSIDNSKNLEPIFNFSRYGKNIVVIMIDSALSGYVPYIFDEKPELLENFSGFIYYPNCISFGGHTRIGAPVIFGGYEYQPKNIQKNRSFAMQKHNEALLMMPRIFLQEGYKVTVTDPTMANYSLKPDIGIFSPYPEIKAVNILGNYTNIWLKSHPELKIVSIPELLKNNLLRFSFFRMSPPAFRIFVYDKARWLRPGGLLSNNQLSMGTLDCYTTLYYFPIITSVSDYEFNTYISIVNDLTHNPAFFQYPDYEPNAEVYNKGYGPFFDDKDYHSNITALILLGKWLKFMQDEQMYDNIRIVIVSDHGIISESKYKGNMKLLNGDMLSAYNPLLLVKDFNSHGDLITDSTFMTNADVPMIAMNGIISNPINPFSNTPIVSSKEDGITITTSNALQFNISDDQWLQVRKNIFDPNNWERAEK